MNTFQELQNRHFALLRQMEDQPDPAARKDLVEPVRAYILEMQKAAEDIMVPVERNQLRANLRFWGSFLYEQTGQYPNTTLNPPNLAGDRPSELKKEETITEGIGNLPKIFRIMSVVIVLTVSLILLAIWFFHNRATAYQATQTALAFRIEATSAAVTALAAGDDDLDGLSNTAELSFGTDPANPDTDGDGLSDGDENRVGTNPLNRDTDSDGLADNVDADPLALPSRTPTRVSVPTNTAVAARTSTATATPSPTVVPRTATVAALFTQAAVAQYTPTPMGVLIPVTGGGTYIMWASPQLGEGAGQCSGRSLSVTWQVSQIVSTNLDVLPGQLELIPLDRAGEVMRAMLVPNQPAVHLELAGPTTERAYLLKVAGREVFESLLIDFPADCSWNDLQIVYHAQDWWLQPKPEAPVADLGLDWSVVTWGPWLEGWAVKLSYQGRGGSGVYIYSVGDVYPGAQLPGKTEVDVMSLYCESLHVNLSVISAGEFYQEKIYLRPLIPACWQEDAG